MLNKETRGPLKILSNLFNEKNQPCHNGIDALGKMKVIAQELVGRREKEEWDTKKEIACKVGLKGIRAKEKQKKCPQIGGHM